MRKPFDTVLRYRDLPRIDPTLSTEPADSADLDAIRDLERSPGYALFSMRVVSEIRRKQDELEQPGDIASTQYIRGMIYALRTVLNMPAILKGEMKNAATT
jgi:hypothetical protein